MKSRLLLLLLLLGLSCAAVAANPQVEMKTSQGMIVLELYPDKAPKTVENFLGYVENGLYKGSVFHRVIDNFVIQGGRYDTYFREKTAWKRIYNEAKNGLKNEAFTLAMARTKDPHSAVSQFFINLKDNPSLDFTEPTVKGWGYTVFGKVVKGQEIATKIGKVPTGAREPFASDVPLENVVIEDIRVIKN
ncbi:MAG: peptidylprolyl isomerase [Sulfuricella sp.]|nr:peptidylprolyl isomerase [Sulfuricella sp.]